jgi:hypothetical protein
MNRTKHGTVLSALERRAMRYKYQCGGADTHVGNQIDETGTVGTEGLTDDDSAGSSGKECQVAVMQRDMLEASGVADEVLTVHGIAPGSKADGVFRLVYENCNGLSNKISGNEKLEKAKEILDDLEVDVACYNEHRQNLMHKDNRNGFSQLFRGGEAEVRSVAAHNTHEGKDVGRVQEGGTAMLLFGQLVEQFDFEASGRDDSGLGRWVVMVFRGENGLTTRIVCGYNPCYNRKQQSRTSYQQARRYYITKEKDVTCPRKRFRDDLIKQLTQWREEGDRLVVCLDANEDIYRKELGKKLTAADGLNLTEVVGDFTGSKIGATYFRGTKPIDGVWATNDLQVVGACVMPAGYGIGDHRMFVVDFRVDSIVGMTPPKIVRLAARRLNTKIPHVVEKYQALLESKMIEHKLNSRLVDAERRGTSVEDVRQKVNSVDADSRQYMTHAEKKCRKIKSGRIPFSPEASVWIRRRQVYESLLRRLDGKIKNRSNLRRSAQRCGIPLAFQLSRTAIHQRLAVCADKCQYFERHGHRYRQRHLQQRLSVARQTRNSVAEEKILAIIQREKERSFWRRMTYAMSKRTGRSVTMVQREASDGGIEEARTQEEVEHMIWEEIHGKRFYLAEQAPICQGRLRGDFGYMANTKAAQDVLDGRYEFPVNGHQGTKDILDEVARIRSVIPANSVSTDLRRPAWKEKWRGAKEKTSSSLSGLHFGHYIAGSTSEIISHHHALKATICLKRGFAIDRWKGGMTCILEKLPGCCLVTKLRAILLMEADYNAKNKIIFGVRMMDNARLYKMMQDEIYSEQGRTAEDGALAKILFYDLVRQTRWPASIASIDAANCYDSIAHAIASLIFQAFGVPVEGVQAMLEAIQDMKYFLRTAYGDSKGCAQSKIEIKYQGLCQGNGAAPAGWAVISITVLRAHKRRGHGATFRCPISKVSATLAAILFVDDCDMLHMDMVKEETALETFANMQASVKNWGDLLIASGGAYKPQKCFYHLISFVWDRKGQWSYANNHVNEAYQMVVPMPDGSEVEIDHLPVTEPKETLGVWSSPVGCAKGAIARIQTKAQEWIDRAKEGKLRRRDVWFMLDCQFWPRVGYGLCCNIAPYRELEDCLRKQYYELLPIGGVLRSSPAPIRQMHKGFYGVGCPHLGIESFIGQVSKLLMHYGCGSNVGMQSTISYRKLIIELGLTMQPLQASFEDFGELVTWCWMTSLWEKCSKFNVKVVVTDTALEMPRERDKWMMQEFIRVGYKGSDLRRLNRVRLYQQVLYLSDIVNASGGELDERYLRQRSHHEQWSTLDYPKEQPAAGDFRLWACALRRVVPAGGLPVRLGRLLHDGYKIWEWRVNRAESYLAHYHHGRMDVYEPAANSRRRWHRVVDDCEPEVLGLPCNVRIQDEDTVTIVSSVEPPVPEEHPSSIREVLGEWGGTWVWKSLRIIGDENWLLLSIRAGTCLAVTDGSYIKEITKEACSSGFVLECTEGRGRIVGSFPEKSKDACAYRGELLGLLAIHLVLLAANKLDPELQGSVEIVSDCLGALSRITSLPDNRIPSGCKHSDILKVIMMHCKHFTFDCEYIHVDAHQDEQTPYAQLTRKSQLNCCMDSLAKQVIWLLMGEELPTQEALPLEPVAVFVGGEKMTSGSEDNLRFWCHRALAKESFAHRKVKVLNGEQFEEVHWRSCYGALCTVPRMFQVWACKQVMGVAGTNEMQARYTPGHDKRCPSCSDRIETCGHVLQCEEEGRVDVLHRSIGLLAQWMEDNDTDKTLQDILISYAHGRGGTPVQELVVERTASYVRLARSMDCIGWRRFMEGMISVEIVSIQARALERSESRVSIRRWAEGLVTKLLEVTHGQWLYRNVHVYDFKTGDLASKRKEELRRALEDQIELGGEGLAREDEYLLDINLDDLDDSSGEDHAIWLLALRAAREAYQLRGNNGLDRAEAPD